MLARLAPFIIKVHMCKGCVCVCVAVCLSVCDWLEIKHDL